MSSEDFPRGGKDDAALSGLELREISQKAKKDSLFDVS